MSDVTDVMRTAMDDRPVLGYRQLTPGTAPDVVTLTSGSCSDDIDWGAWEQVWGARPEPAARQYRFVMHARWTGDTWRISYPGPGPQGTVDEPDTAAVERVAREHMARAYGVPVDDVTVVVTYWQFDGVLTDEASDGCWVPVNPADIPGA